MKKYTFIALALMLALCCASCSSGAYDPAKLSPSDFDEAKLDGMLTLEAVGDAGGITLILGNPTQNAYTYGARTDLEVNIGGIWYKAPAREDSSWIEMGYILSAESSRYDKFYPKDNYVAPISGKYRVIKELHNGSEPTYVCADIEL